MDDTPKDLATALEEADLAEFFADCTGAHRREYLKWIGDAKRAETRKERIAKAVKMLADKSAKENARTKKKA
jgi:uncharacterized protein YdeI (YjbR/CyaY-like superfamily)